MKNQDAFAQTRKIAYWSVHGVGFGFAAYLCLQAVYIVMTNAA